MLGNNVGAPPDNLCQAFRKRKSLLEKVIPTRKIDQEIDIAVGAVLTSRHGAEHTDAARPELTTGAFDGLSVCTQSLRSIAIRRTRIVSGYDCTGATGRIVNGGGPATPKRPWPCSRKALDRVHGEYRRVHPHFVLSLAEARSINPSPSSCR